MPPELPSGQRVTCIACGAELPRAEAREYDKHGDRWDRDGKQFEYLCKPCFQELSKEPRDGLEAVLVDVDAGRADREAFVTQYLDAIEDRPRDGTEPDNE